jgi:hypothetical protein
MDYERIKAAMCRARAADGSVPLVERPHKIMTGTYAGYPREHCCLCGWWMEPQHEDVIDEQQDK